MTTKTKTTLNTQAATKVADQLIARLFDHRQFTSGEIRYLINELDEQCKGDSLEKALKQNQETSIVSDLMTNEVAKIDLNKFSYVESQVESLLVKVDKLVATEQIQKEKCDTLLTKQRNDRDRIKKDCRSQIDNNCRKIDDSMKKKEEELETRYINFEKKLQGTKLG